MVSILTRVFGTEHLELAEDVVQQTFIDAIHVWKLKGIPDNPSAWLFRVAKNKAIDSIRRNKYAVQFDFSDSRLTAEGEIILLPQQDRSKWDAKRIELGNAYMNEAAFGSVITPYHIEAAIAYEHCTAPNFEQTNWQRILELYEWLCRVAYSPIAALNKTVAILQVYGPQQALEAFNDLAPEKAIQSYYLYHSLLGELYAQLGRKNEAQQSFTKAIQLTGSEAEKKVLRNKIPALI